MYKESLEEAKKELPKILSRGKDNYFLANYFNDLGLFHTKLNQADSAITCFIKAQDYLAQSKKTDPVQRLFFNGLIKGNIGQALMLEKKYREAIPLLKDDVKYSILSNHIENAAISQNEIARCYLELKQPLIARLYIDSAYKVFVKFESMKQMLFNRKLLLDLYKAENNQQKILETYVQYSKLQDSIIYSEANRNLINQQVMHELELKESENNKKQEIIVQEQLKNENYVRKQYVFILILILSAFLIGLLVYYSIRGRQKQKVLALQYFKINEQKTIIETSLVENQNLLNEIHHRVKNNLQIISSLLNLQSDKISNQEANRFLHDSKRRIESMAIIHHLLYKRSSFGEVEIDVYLETLVSKISHSFSNPEKQVELNFTLQPLKLHMDKAIPLGLVINEIITNSYKYAFNNVSHGKVSISLEELDGKICIIASDNGCGFPLGWKEMKIDSLGLELIDLLYNQLNAKLEINNSDGVNYKIVF